LVVTSSNFATYVVRSQGWFFTAKSVDRFPQDNVNLWKTYSRQRGESAELRCRIFSANGREVFIQ